MLIVHLFVSYAHVNLSFDDLQSARTIILGYIYIFSYAPLILVSSSFSDKTVSAL